MDGNYLFGRFPAEVRAIIFQNLDDYDDVVSLSRAYPEMIPLLRKVKHLGLFEETIAHIAKWLSVETLLCCRLVSKQWVKGVDHFLESAPPTHKHFPQPYPALRDLRKVSMCHFGRRYCDPPGIFRAYFEEMHSFTKQGKLDNFLLKMEGHPPNRNPFLGRAVKLNLSVVIDQKTIVPPEEQYWQCVLRLLQKWGRHIWYLGITLEYRQPRSCCQYLKECLWLLPNLRGLKIEGDAPWYFEMMDTKWKKHLGLDDLGTFPELAHLEHMHSFYRGMPQLGDTLMTRYCTQLRRLQLRLEENWTWSWSWGEEKYARLLPNLTELEVEGRSPGSSTGCLKLNQILLSLNTPKLQSLLVKGSWDSAGNELAENVLGKDDVQRWLKRFPCLTNLHLPDYLLSAITGCAESPNFRATSVKELGLHISSLDEQLLLGFPEVRTLRIYYGNYERAIPWTETSPGAEATLRKLASEWGLVNVWKVLPKLNKLHIVDSTRDSWEPISKLEYEECVDD